MNKSAHILVVFWLLWSRVQNPKSENPSWMPLNTFEAETACRDAAVKATDTLANLQRNYSSELTPIRPMKQRNVVLTYFKESLVSTTIYSCVEHDPTAQSIKFPHKNAFPSY